MDALRAVRRRALSFVSAAAVLACGGQKAEPIPECQQYEAALNVCFHRDSVFSADRLVPKDDADRARARQFCADNLHRIQVACR